MTRWLYPPERAPQPAASFDPVAEGAQHGLPRDAAEALWKQIWTDAVESADGHDVVHAPQRFRELAPDLAASSGQPASRIGKITRANLESAVARDALTRMAQQGAVGAPGRRTLVELEAWPRPGFEDHRVIGLRELLERLGADLPLRQEVIAAAVIEDRSLAGRATGWRERLPAPPPAGPSQAGTALWRVAGRRAVTLYRRALERGDVADEGAPAVARALQELGGGQLLSDDLRRELAPAVGATLAHVRIHTDEVAAQAAQALGAEAFTVGEDIFFAAGAYAPDTHAGRKLLVHELTHVAQAQRGRTAAAHAGLRVSQPGDPEEQEAEAAAERASSAAAERASSARAPASIKDVAPRRRAGPLLFGLTHARLDALRGSAPAAIQRKAAPAAPGGPWEHLFRGPSTPVNQLGRVQAPRGRTLLSRPDPAAAPAMTTPLPFDALVMVLRRTTQPSATERWCYVTAPDHGTSGFCEERYIAIDPPEPRAHLHRVGHGETLGQIARAAYGDHITAADNERLYVQGLYEANKGRPGLRLTPVQLSLGETWHRGEDEEATLRIYRGVQVLEGLSLWIPSREFIQRLKAAGVISSGSSEFSKAWRAAAGFVDDTVEAVKYAAGFVVGMLEGAWSAIVDLFQGAAEMIEAIATALYHLVTGNPGRIKDMLMKWVDKMKSAWEQRDKIADEFLQKWNAPSGWDRGRFQGEVLGWVVMTILIIVVTAGAGAAAKAGTLAARFPQVVKLLQTVDAVGDVTTYLGGAIRGVKAARKVPAAAADLVKGKLGKAARHVDAPAEQAEREARKQAERAAHHEAEQEVQDNAEKASRHKAEKGARKKADPEAPKKAERETRDKLVEDFQSKGLDKPTAEAFANLPAALAKNFSGLPKEALERLSKLDDVALQRLGALGPEVLQKLGKLDFKVLKKFVGWDPKYLEKIGQLDEDSIGIIAKLQIAPGQDVVNALGSFNSHRMQFGPEQFLLDKKAMKHVLERHHPQYWDGSVKVPQSFLSPKMTVEDIVNAVDSIMKANRDKVIAKGTNGMFQISGEWNGTRYIVGLNNGRVGQFYPVP